MQREGLDKIIVNIGLGRMSQDSGFKDKMLPAVMDDLALITGQRPAVSKARKSIASFKLRQGETIGIKTTLRGKRRDDFLSRLVNIVLPRVRDFRGIDLKQMDGQGNLSIGLRDHTVFPEINQETSRFSFGLQVTLVPNAYVDRDKEKMAAFYKSLGVPLRVE